MTPLAHMGGVPEALSVLVPLALVVVMLRVGAKRMPHDEDEDETPDAPAADERPPAS